MTIEYTKQVLQEIFSPNPAKTIPQNPVLAEYPPKPENWTEYWEDRQRREYNNSNANYPGYEGL